jgi:hypothetical protein
MFCFSFLTARVIHQNRSKKAPLTLRWWSFWENLLKKYRAQPPPEGVNNDEAKLLLSF